MTVGMMILLDLKRTSFKTIDKGEHGITDDGDPHETVVFAER